MPSAQLQLSLVWSLNKLNWLISLTRTTAADQYRYECIVHRAAVEYGTRRRSVVLRVFEKRRQRWWTKSITTSIVGCDALATKAIRLPEKQLRPESGRQLQVDHVIRTWVMTSFDDVIKFRLDLHFTNRYRPQRIFHYKTRFKIKTVSKKQAERKKVYRNGIISLYHG